MSHSTERDAAADENSLEGPDIETATNDSEGTPKPGGLGEDGTIPNHPNGVAVGHTGEASTFEPEEGEGASS